MFERPFHRMNDHQIFGGVAAGLAYSMGVPTWIVRLVWLILFVMMGGLPWGLIYLGMWGLMPLWPVDPGDFEQVTDFQEDHLE